MNRFLSGIRIRTASQSNAKVVALADIPSWYQRVHTIQQHIVDGKVEEKISAPSSLDALNNQRPLSKKIRLYQGDITKLGVDAIVNAANSALRAGGGVCGAIHSAAGSRLEDACMDIGFCDTGSAVITPGFNLPAKYVIHAVGPTREDAEKLAGCYKTSLDLCLKHSLTSIAFPCISTGIYGYDNEKAARVAISTVKNWLEAEDHESKMAAVIFCVFLPEDLQIYEELLPKYF